jgi:hypothetical protein
MLRWLLLGLLSLTLVASTSAAAVRTAAHTKQQAEVNVLRAVPRTWKARRLRGLINPRTHLLANDTEAICRGRGESRDDGRYTRFRCVVRPHVHTRRQGLYLGYRALTRTRFKLRWLAYYRR